MAEVRTPRSNRAAVGAQTPPAASSRLRRADFGAAAGAGVDDSRSFDPASLADALEGLSRTPKSASPHRKRVRMVGDRFIPTRSADRIATFSLLDDDVGPVNGKKALLEPQTQRQELANRTYKDLLRAEMFDSPAPSATSSGPGSRTATPAKPAAATPANGQTPPSGSRNLFSFGASGGSGRGSGARTRQKALNLDPESDIYRLSPFKSGSEKILSTAPRPTRQIPKVPFKVLDAPELADDFYLNLVDWGKHNVLAVGLRSSVYLWDSNTGKVVRLCDLGHDIVTCVNWAEEGTVLAIGTGSGRVQLWDTTTQKKLRVVDDHEARVGAIAWNSFVLTSGGRDRCIYHRDVREPDGPFLKLAGHKQEVCGLKWNTVDNQLASGGNDNKLLVWDRLASEPLYRFTDHKAAVKAIAWSPHQRGLLASGGGTADRTIKFWDTLISSERASHAAASAAAATCDTMSGASGFDIDFNSHGLAVGGLGAATASAHILGTRAGRPKWAVPKPGGLPMPNLLGSFDTGSQVCNLAWSLASNELVSSHGYSQNQIIVWKYPSMRQVSSLMGHTYRVLYLAMSPTGDTIVTGAGDETLRFWNVFPKAAVVEDGLGEVTTTAASAEQRSAMSASRLGASASTLFDNATIVEKWGTLR